MTFDVIMTIYIILSGIVVHITWKRIENLEDWVMYLLEKTDCLIVDARFKAHCLNCAESGSYKCKKCDGEMYYKDTPQKDLVKESNEVVKDLVKTDCPWK